ncbi:MAG: M23 family metallopeptidase, partial [Deltaproteobacteria bacterium]|nr:M23 family metallopeptidase [Deltaproteobacteria bacterium]
FHDHFRMISPGIQEQSIKQKSGLPHCLKSLVLLLSLTICFVMPLSGKTRHSLSNYFKITLSASSIKQGQVLTVFVDSANRLKQIELSFLGQKLPMYHMWHKEHDHLFRAFLGIPIGTRPGSYKIVAHGIDSHKQSLSIYATIQVRHGRYKIQQINLSKKKTKLLDHETLRQEGAILKKRFLKKDKKVYFASRFKKPAKGRISSTFGLRRKYNGNKVSSYHKGIDIANKTGTAVHAANAGQVTLAVKWKSHGNTILINHGHGVVTVYIHLDQLLVKTGAWVKRGQIVGRLGSTGITSGPNLHFGVSVNDIRVDPSQWINNRIKLFY